MPNFSEIRIAEGDKLWISRDPAYLTNEAVRLSTLLDFPNSVLSRRGERAERIKETKRDGTQQRSIEITYDGRPMKKTYLDADAPIPSGLEYSHSDRGIRFEEYSPFGGHQFPRTLVEFKKNQTLIRVQVQELTEAGPLSSSSFTPPTTARWMHWCADPLPPKLQDPQKIIPIHGTLGRDVLEANVRIYGIIGTDGLWHNLAVVKSGGKEVDSYLMKVYSEQRFSPATCAGNAVEFEMVVEVR